MKIDELYFGYTPYSKYALNEDNTTEQSVDKDEQDNTIEKKNTKEKVNKNTKVNIDAYFRLTKESEDNINGVKGFAEELQSLLNTPLVADSMAVKLKKSEEEIAIKNEEIEQLTKQMEELKKTANVISTIENKDDNNSEFDEGAIEKSLEGIHRDK